jgi:hypothetical protein
MSMRCSASILSRLILAGALMVSLVTAALGQDRDATRREWGALANGRTEFEVSDPALLPGTLARAADDAGCSYKDGIKDVPARFMRPEGRRIVILFCSAIVGSHEIFDVSNVMKPTPIALSVIAHPTGFRTATRPGMITWRKEAGVFQVEAGSDASWARLRHIYRVEPGTGSFAVVRVEFNPDVSGKDAWITIWDAPDWPFPPKRN